MQKRIQELNPAITLSDDDLIAIDQSSQSSKETLSNLKDYILGWPDKAGKTADCFDPFILS